MKTARLALALLALPHLACVSLADAKLALARRDYHGALALTGHLRPTATAPERMALDALAGRAHYFLWAENPASPPGHAIVAREHYEAFLSALSRPATSRDAAAWRTAAQVAHYRLAVLAAARGDAPTAAAHLGHAGPLLCGEPAPAHFEMDTFAAFLRRPEFRRLAHVPAIRSAVIAFAAHRHTSGAEVTGALGTFLGVRFFEHGAAVTRPHHGIGRYVLWRGIARDAAFRERDSTTVLGMESLRITKRRVATEYRNSLRSYLSAGASIGETGGVRAPLLDTNSPTASVRGGVNARASAERVALLRPEAVYEYAYQPDGRRFTAIARGFRETLVRDSLASIYGRISDVAVGPDGTPIPVVEVEEAVPARTLGESKE